MADHDGAPARTDPGASEGGSYLRAGLAYGLLGAAILVVTVASPGMARPERRADLAHLLAGLPFFVLFALAIAYGDRAFAAIARVVRVPAPRARRLGAWLREKLVMLLSLSGLGRTAVFLGNGVGQRPRLRRSPFGVELEPVAADPRMLVNAALMATICGFLIHAAWRPAWRRWRGRNGDATRHEDTMGGES